MFPGLIFFILSNAAVLNSIRVCLLWNCLCLLRKLIDSDVEFVLSHNSDRQLNNKYSCNAICSFFFQRLQLYFCFQVTS